MVIVVTGLDLRMAMAPLVTELILSLIPALQCTPSISPAMSWCNHYSVYGDCLESWSVPGDTAYRFTSLTSLGPGSPSSLDLPSADKMRYLHYLCPAGTTFVFSALILALQVLLSGAIITTFLAPNCILWALIMASNQGSKEYAMTHILNWAWWDS